MDSAIAFSELLLYNQHETRRWKEWFSLHPEALELPFEIAKTKTVRGLLFHIFAVEALFAHAVSNDPAPDWQKVQARVAADLFSISEDAGKKFQSFIDSARPEDWGEVKEVGSVGIKASKRKMMTQAFLHGVHHRGQLATHLRQQGFEMWPQDFILTDVMP